VSAKQDLTGTDTRLRNACQQVESFFWNQLLAAMDQTIPDDGVLGASFAKDVWQDMQNQQYALLLAQQNSGNSLSDVLYQQLSSQQQVVKNNNSIAPLVGS